METWLLTWICDYGPVEVWFMRQQHLPGMPDDDLFVNIPPVLWRTIIDVALHHNNDKKKASQVPCDRKFWLPMTCSTLMELQMSICHWCWWIDSDVMCDIIALDNIIDGIFYVRRNSDSTCSCSTLIVAILSSQYSPTIHEALNPHIFHRTNHIKFHQYPTLFKNCYWLIPVAPYSIIHR